MRISVPKLLRTVALVAVTSAAFGYGLACLAGPFADAQAALLRGNTNVPSERMRVRMPLALAATSVAVVVAFEAMAALLRRNDAAPATPKPRVATASGMDAEVEALLNGILAQTEADRLAQTPPPEAETSGTGGPRNLSTAH